MLKDIKNPAMVTLDDRRFREWVANRFDTMAEDTYWRRDNPALVPQARRIAYAATKNQPISLADAKTVVEEVVSFEDVLKADRLWAGAKRFLIDSGEVRVLTEEEAARIFVSRGRPEWFRHGGKMYVGKKD